MLSYLYLFKTQGLKQTDGIGYFLIEPRSKHILAFDFRGDLQSNQKLVEDIENQTGGELKFMFNTKSKGGDKEVERLTEWRDFRPNI